ncbi:DUF6624 domain-containing protein [Streptomyces sp. NPDC005900]|uniref:DUF6624 domain-containing protein n=1 Tax=unclassified Streptomyces TaxID=2593676 RepID=UPI000691D255|nr:MULTISPECIES: DUF6624 domain-containing protein [unclassified Streptomyces]AZM57359.1 hypothetical protein DMA15_36375 [Streptomyces sp. WAC 01529]
MTSAPETATAPRAAQLAAELRRRADWDQDVRRTPGKSAADVARWMAVDAENQQWIWRVLREHGWPGHRLVGEQGSDDAALLVQHADRDRPLQRYGLELLIEAVDAGDATASHVAYLIDRIHLHAGVPTRYGTQYARAEDGRYRMLPVEEPGGLDARRAQLGIPPVAEFERQLRELHAGTEMLEEYQ